MIRVTVKTSCSGKITVLTILPYNLAKTTNFRIELNDSTDVTGDQLMYPIMSVSVPTSHQTL